MASKKKSSVVDINLSAKINDIIKQPGHSIFFGGDTLMILGEKEDNSLMSLVSAVTKMLAKLTKILTIRGMGIALAAFIDDNNEMRKTVLGELTKDKKEERTILN